MDCGPPGSSVHGILQARILHWAAISFSKTHSASVFYYQGLVFIIGEAGFQVQFHLIQRQHFYSIEKKKAYIIRPLV